MNTKCRAACKHQNISLLQGADLLLWVLNGGKKLSTKVGQVDHVVLSPINEHCEAGTEGILKFRDQNVIVWIISYSPVQLAWGSLIHDAI